MVYPPPPPLATIKHPTPTPWGGGMFYLSLSVYKHRSSGLWGLVALVLVTVSPSSKIAPSHPQSLEYSLPCPGGLPASVFWSPGSGSPGADTCTLALGWPPSLSSGGTS